MAYDEVLAERVGERLRDMDVTSKKMFGAMAFLLGGNVLVTVFDEGLMVRVGRDGTEEALSRPGVTPLVIRGREQRGWVVVAEEALDDDVLDGWLEVATAVTATLPPK